MKTIDFSLPFYAAINLNHFGFYLALNCNDHYYIGLRLQ